MTMDKIRKLASLVEECSNDDEMAHFMERNLWRIVLLAIAENEIPKDEIVNACKIALSTQDIEFDRWFA
jgi:hypothetical protein